MSNLATRTVGLIGLGQIGGSLGLDLTGQRPVRRVIGYDSDETTLRAAFDRKAVDSIASHLEDLVEEADLMVVATPIRAAIDLIPRLAEITEEATVITDVAGTKAAIVERVESNGLGTRYVSAHPMAGSEGTGIRSAKRGLFQGRTVVVTSADGAASENVALIESLWQSVGSVVVRMRPQDHDRAVALTSHLPYALAITLVRMAAEESAKETNLTKLIAGSFTSATRVAASSPDLTLDMWLSNREAVANRIQRFADALSRLAELIHQGNETGLRQQVVAAREFVMEMSSN